MTSRIVLVFVLGLVGSGLAACGGTKILKDPQPIEIVQPLALAESEDVAATLAWVIVRDGPGTWARNADWDEYLIAVTNPTSAPIQVDSIALVDSLGTRVVPATDRKALVKGSKQAVRRYRESGLKVKAGMGGLALAATGAVVWYGVAAPLATAALWGGTAATGVAAMGAVIATPVLAVGGIMRANNNRKVNNEIQRRQTELPLTLAPGEARQITVFFPLTPSPTEIALTHGDARLVMDTSEILKGLHLPD
ncbi:MAG: hypothetical protein WD081_09045 [Gammaproteobacteria bacterium]